MPTELNKVHIHNMNLEQLQKQVDGFYSLIDTFGMSFLSQEGREYLEDIKGALMNRKREQWKTAQEKKMRDVLDRAGDMLGYIVLLNRQPTENEIKKAEALQIEIEHVLAEKEGTHDGTLS